MREQVSKFQNRRDELGNYLSGKLLKMAGKLLEIKQWYP